jgi:PIN domain nuclease of toxin-antitoxin system
VSSGAVALARGLGVVAEVADQIDLRDAHAKASDVEAKITSEWLKWDASPEGRAKYKGANADGYASAAEAWWKNARETYGNELNHRAKALASKSLTAKQLAALGQVRTFTLAEKERHADETYSADVATTIQFGVTSGDVASTAQQIRDKAAVLGARKGWTTEQVQAEQQKNLSAMHLAQISKLAETNAQAAQAYYDANKAEVNFAQQARVEQVLKGEADNQFATQEAARLAAMPLKEQLAEASNITDPQRREKTLTQIRNNYALVKQAEQEVESRASDQAWQLFAQGKKIPEAVLAAMDGRNRVQLQDAQRVRAERAAAGTAVKTDWATYIDVRERLAAGERVDLRTLTEKIGPAQMEQLLDIQTSASKGGGKQDSMLTDEGRINAALTGLGIDKKKDPKSAAALIGEIDRQVRVESAAKGGKDLTADEKQKVVDRVVMNKVYIDEFGRDPEKPLAIVPPEDLAKAYVRVEGKNVPVSSVPATDRRQIIQALQATGQTVTEQAVVEMYLAGKKKPATNPPLIDYPQTPPPAAVTLPARSAPAAAPINPPSIYASPEEWARYRAQQTGQRP